MHDPVGRPMLVEDEKPTRAAIIAALIAERSLPRRLKPTSDVVAGLDRADERVQVTAIVRGPIR
jgi:hypothetical protein